MRTARTYILTITLTFIFITVGFFLPERIISYTDQTIIGKVEIESVDLPKSISGNDISMIEKIGLLRDYPQNVNRITLEVGTNLNLTSANAKFFEEISVLKKLGLLPEIESGDKTTIKIDVSLYAQKDDPSISGVFWNIVLQEDKFLGNFYMDDHTGKIIQFIVTVPDKPLITEEAIKVWAEYLGLEAQKIEFQPESYSIWEDETTKVSERGYDVYNFEFGFEDNVLPYAFFTFENGYGFGYVIPLQSKLYNYEAKEIQL